MRALTPLGCGLLLGLAAPVAGAGPWVEVKLPPRTTAEWVSDDAVVNGLPSRIQQFTSELSVAEVLAFFERQWATSAAGAPRRFNTPGWSAVSTLAGGKQVAVQVRPIKGDAGSEGLISWGDLQHAQRPVAPDWLPRQSDTRIAQSVLSTDGPVRSERLTLVSPAALEVVVQRWRSHWERQGWRRVFERDQPATSGAVGRTWMASFERPPLTADVVVTWQASVKRSVTTVNLLSPATTALTQ